MDRELTELDEEMLKLFGRREEMIDPGMLKAKTLKMLPPDDVKVTWARIWMAQLFLEPSKKTRASDSIKWHIGNPLGMSLMRFVWLLSMCTCTWLIYFCGSHTVRRSVVDAIIVRLLLAEHFEELLQTYEVWLPRAAREAMVNTTCVSESYRNDLMQAAWTLRRLFAHSQAWKGYPSSILIRIISICLKMFALVRIL